MGSIRWYLTYYMKIENYYSFNITEFIYLLFAVERELSKTATLSDSKKQQNCVYYY